MEVSNVHKGFYYMGIFRVPNLLTILRISLIPIFILAFYWQNEWRSLIVITIFLLAALTDWLDGYLARRLKQASSVGAFLDPVADKLIVVVALVLLVEIYRTPVISIPTALIVCREISVSALREWMAELGKRAEIAVSYIGKFKTAFQMIAIIILLLQPSWLGGNIILIGYIFLYLSMILAIWSMYQYLEIAWCEIQKEKGLDR